MSKELNFLQEKFPFLTLFEYAGEEYLGIIQNGGKNIVSVYVYNNIKEDNLKRKFIELAQDWWWSSNRKIPINLFFKTDFDIFQPYVVNFITKEFKLINGHSVSLESLNSRRVKRRRTEFIVKPDK